MIAWLIEGKGPAEIASLVSTPKQRVSRQAICGFKKRHEAEITPVAEAVGREITDYAIAAKVNRIAEYDHIYSLMRQEADEYGLAVTEVHFEKDGETRTETRDFRAGLVREMRGALHDVAEELAQLPRSDVHVGDKNVFILNVSGVQQRELG